MVLPQVLLFLQTLVSLQLDHFLVTFFFPPLELAAKVASPLQGLRAVCCLPERLGMRVSQMLESRGLESFSVVTTAMFSTDSQKAAIPPCLLEFS